MKNQPKSEILHDFSPWIKVYDSGLIERLQISNPVPPSIDPKTRVHSKDVTLSSSGLSARLYIPSNISENTKLPLLIYIHGGAFCLFSASSSIYHNYLNSLVSVSNVIAVSLDYRLAPEHPIPACYDDSWTLTQWATGQSQGQDDPDPWLTRWADLSKLYFGGDSAGANIAHEMVIRAGSCGMRVAGIVLVHPFFGEDGENPLWDFLCPTTEVGRDVRMDPRLDPSRLKRELRCDRVLVCVGEKDFLLKGKAVSYYELLREGGEWNGEVVFWMSKRKGHVFHLFKPECIEAKELLMCVACFIGSSRSQL